MKPNIQLFCATLLLGLLLGACNLAATDDEATESFSYTVQEEKQIIIDTTQRQLGDSTRTLLQLSIEDGDKRLFTYNRSRKQPENVTDGGFSAYLYFQLPPHKQQFSYQDDELTQINTYYRQSCFCRRLGAIPVSEGYIRGEQLSSSIWKVTALVQIDKGIEGISQIRFDDIFITKR
ncbi:MAG: hypothetical protein U5J63_18050 [Fodinibius sp.]|nr:hypothetical protein [Fodinibius sp.]